MIIFDDIEAWEPKLAAVLHPYLPESVDLKLKAASPKYLEDARDVLLNLTDRDAVIDAMLAWISSEKIAGYHGSRLTDAEVASIREGGLIPLKAESRRNRIERALSPHPEWPRVVDQVCAVLHDLGPGSRTGHREGQVHLTLSKSGLTNHFNHYLLYGSEFDQHAAHKLLGQAGITLLAQDGEARVIEIAVPGAYALDAAHPFFDVDMMRARGEIPNIVKEFLEAWSFRLAHPGFQSQSMKADCGMIFRSTVPASWVANIGTASTQHEN